MSSPEASPEALAIEDPGAGRVAIVQGAAWSRAGGPRNLRSLEDALSALADPDMTVWVDLEEAGNAELAQLAGPLGLHPLVVEDIIDRDQRAKVEYTGDVMHLVMFAAIPDRDLPELAEIDIVLTPRCLATSHPPEWRPLEQGVTARMGAAHFLAKGADAALYGVLDAIVDSYFPVIDRLTETVDELEDAAIERPNRSVVERLFAARRSLLMLRRAVSPEREVLNQLTNRDNPLIDGETLVYFRDVYDHLVRINQSIDAARETVNTAIQVALAMVATGQGEITRRLAAYAALVAVPTMIAGVYGMNFRHMPELAWELGYPVAIAVMVAIDVFLFTRFRKAGWI
jgi:magnesium transporter